MKLGATNSKKTWIAVGLAVVALLLTARMVMTSFWSPSTAAATSAPPATTSAARPAARPAPQRRVHLASIKSGANADSANNLDPRLHLDLLKETESTVYDGEGRNIFMAQTQDVKIPPVVQTPLKQPVQPPIVDNTPPPPPPPPPINLKFFGFASQEGAKSVFLSSGEDVFIAKEGEIVQRRYKILKINANSIEVKDMLNNNQQTIPLTAG